MKLMKYNNCFYHFNPKKYRDKIKLNNNSYLDSCVAFLKVY